MKSRVVVCVVILIGLVCAGGTVPASPSDGQLPSETRRALEDSVRGWIGEQAQGSENEFGKPTKRGYFSRFFEPLDDGSYNVTVHIETAGQETKVTERFLLTVKKTADGFEVVDGALQDTYSGQHRDSGGQCAAFEKFSFDREGLRMEGTNGTVCVTLYRDRVADFNVHSADMSYSYAPPDYAAALHLNRDFHAVYPTVRSDHRRELEFEPAAFLFSCDPDSCDELLEDHFSGLEMPSAPEADSGWNVGSAAWARPLAENWQKDRRENPFAHFKSPYRPGHRTWSVFVVRELDPFSYPGFEEGLFDFAGSLPGGGIQLVFDNWAGWEIRFNVWPRRITDGFFGVPVDKLFGTLYGYYSEQTLKNSSPSDLERRPDVAKRWHEVFSVNGEVDMALDKFNPALLSADIEFGIRLKHAIRELPFAIASIPQRSFSGKNKQRTLYVNSVQLDGEELTWTRTGQLSGLVVLPEEKPAGTLLKLRMNFDTRALVKLNPSFTEVSRFGWMPFVQFGDFIDEFELTVRTPARYQVLGIGTKVSEETEGETLVTHWKAENPVVFPSITFGRYRSDVPGFDAKKKDGTVIPVEVHVDEASFQDWGIRQGQLRPIAEQAANSINLYREISGLDYPYGGLNLVNDAAAALGLFYGQAPSSLIYLGPLVFRSEGTLGHFGGTNIAKALKSLTAHEVGHQWWGSRVANANERNYWFVETLAEYFSALYLEAAYGPDEYREHVEAWRRTVLDHRIKSSVQTTYSVWGGEDGMMSHMANIYNKGPYAFHMLREIFGDEKFFPFLKKLTQEMAMKREIVTMDIQQSTEWGLGGVGEDGQPYKVDLGWFFDQWIRGTGLPQYRLVYDTRQTEDDSWVIEGSIHQRVVVGNSRKYEVLEGTYYRGLANVMVKTKTDKYQTRYILEGAETPFRLKVPDKPIEILLNDDGASLALDTVVNSKWN